MPETNPLTYNGYVSTIAAMAVYNVTTGSNGVTVGVDDPFNTILPQMLNYAELRIQRDLNLWPAHQSNATYTLTTGNNAFAVPVDDFLNVQTLSTVAADGARGPLVPVSKEFIQNVCDTALLGPPQFFAPYGGDPATFGMTSIMFLIGPRPDQPYPIEATGFARLPSLYKQGVPATAASGMTWISINLPDLLLTASMIFITGYQRNFGAMASDPQMGSSWENQYQTLLKGGLTE